MTQVIRRGEVATNVAQKSRTGLEGAFVVLTGAGGGIGEATTVRLLQEGASVLAIDRDEERLEQLRASCGRSGRLFCKTLDVSSEEACAALASDLKFKSPKVDVLINNAGWFPACPLEQTSLAQWRQVFAVNLDSVFLMSKSLLPFIRMARLKKIINIGSSSMFNGPPDHAPYVSAKAGLVGLTRCLARMLGPEGITANMITPGLSDTPGAREVFHDGQIEDTASLRTLRRVQTAQDVVGAIAFLASHDSDFMTGQIVNVDGGQRFH